MERWRRVSQSSQSQLTSWFNVPSCWAPWNSGSPTSTRPTHKESLTRDRDPWGDPWPWCDPVNSGWPGSTAPLGYKRPPYTTSSLTLYISFGLNTTTSILGPYVIDEKEHTYPGSGNFLWIWLIYTRFVYHTYQIYQRYQSIKSIENSQILDNTQKGDIYVAMLPFYCHLTKPEQPMFAWSHQFIQFVPLSDASQLGIFRYSNIRSVEKILVKTIYLVSFEKQEKAEKCSTKQLLSWGKNMCAWFEFNDQNYLVPW